MMVFAEVGRSPDIGLNAAGVDHETASTSFQQLVPVPHKARSTSTKKRRVGHAQCLTSSPYKRALEEAIGPSSSSGKPDLGSKPKSKFCEKRKKVKLLSELQVAQPVITPCLFCCTSAKNYQSFLSLCITSSLESTPPLISSATS